MNWMLVDCDCDGKPAKPDRYGIGILASADPVALDRACADLVYTHKDGDSASMANILNPRMACIHWKIHKSQVLENVVING